MKRYMKRKARTTTKKKQKSKNPSFTGCCLHLEQNHSARNIMEGEPRNCSALEPFCQDILGPHCSLFLTSVKIMWEVWCASQTWTGAALAPAREGTWVRAMSLGAAAPAGRVGLSPGGSGLFSGMGTLLGRDISSRDGKEPDVRLKHEVSWYNHIPAAWRGKFRCCGHLDIASLGHW